MLAKCFDCGSSNIADCGNGYVFDNPFFGLISSRSHHVYQCRDCGMLLMDSACRAFLQEQQQNIVSGYLLTNFHPALHREQYCSESEVIKLVGYVPELVMKIDYNGEILFWKRSIEKFLNNGNDGRIRII